MTVVEVRGRGGQLLERFRSHEPELRIGRAFDNGLFVVACNQTGDNRNGLLFPGNAVVLSPSGEVLETLLDLEIDLPGRAKRGLAKR